MQKCEITDEGAEKFTESLRKVYNLEELSIDFSENNISDKSSYKIGESISRL